MASPPPAARPSWVRRCSDPPAVLPARQWKFRRGLGLVIAGLRPAGLANPPASCRLASLANANAPAASMPPELHLPTVPRPGLAVVGESCKRVWDSRGIARTRVGRSRGWATVAASMRLVLRSSLGWVRGLRSCCGVAASCGSTLVGPAPLRPAGNPAGSPVEVPAWDGLGHSGPPARGMVLFRLHPAGSRHSRTRTLRRHPCRRSFICRRLRGPRQWGRRAQSSANGASCSAGRSHPALKVGGRTPPTVWCSQREPRRQDAAGDAKPLRPGRAAHR